MSEARSKLAPDWPMVALTAVIIAGAVVVTVLTGNDALGWGATLVLAFTRGVVRRRDGEE